MHGKKSDKPSQMSKSLRLCVHVSVCDGSVCSIEHCAICTFIMAQSCTIIYIGNYISVSVCSTDTGFPWQQQIHFLLFRETPCHQLSLRKPLAPLVWADRSERMHSKMMSINSTPIFYCVSKAPLSLQHNEINISGVDFSFPGCCHAAVFYVRLYVGYLETLWS